MEGRQEERHHSIQSLNLLTSDKFHIIILCVLKKGERERGGGAAAAVIEIAYHVELGRVNKFFQVVDVIEKPRRQGMWGGEMCCCPVVIFISSFAFLHFFLFSRPMPIKRNKENNPFESSRR